MFTKIGDLKEGPEDDWRDEHAQKSGQTDLLHDWHGEFKSTADEAKEEEFDEEVEKDCNASEDAGEIPFPLFENGLDTLHEKAHEGIENDGITKFHRLGRRMIDGIENVEIFFSGQGWVDDLLGIPEKAT